MKSFQCAFSKSSPWRPKHELIRVCRGTAVQIDISRKHWLIWRLEVLISTNWREARRGKGQGELGRSKGGGRVGDHRDNSRIVSWGERGMKKEGGGWEKVGEGGGLNMLLRPKCPGWTIKEGRRDLEDIVLIINN